MQAEHGGEAPRTALIVVAGVGDKAQNSTAEEAARNLLFHAVDASGQRIFAHAEMVEEGYSPQRAWFGVQPEQAQCQRVTRYTLFDRAHRPRVDVYEGWWADLSRFPGATRSALLATLGMLFQICAVGRASLRGGPWLAGISRSPRAWSGSGFPASAQLLDAVEWVVAVPIVLITAMHVALLILADYALRVHVDNGWKLAGFTALAAALLAVLSWGIGIWYPGKRSHVLDVGIPLLLGTTGIAVWRSLVDDRDAGRGIADTIFALTVYPFRIAWMVVALLALAVLGSAAWRLWRSGGTPATSAARRISTAGLSSVGPFGLAIVATLIYAAAGNALEKVAEGSTFSRNPWCLQAVNRWTAGDCSGVGGPAAKPLDAFQWGEHLLQVSLTPLLYVIASTLAALLLAALLARLWPGAVPGNRWLERTFHWAPLTMSVAVIPSAVLVILAWLPLGDRLLVWHGWLEPWQVVGTGTAVGAVVLGYVITGFLVAARSLKLSPGNLANSSKIPERLRLTLDLGYDIASFLREPSKPGSVAPRERMLARLAGLLEHVSTARHYARTVFLTHSQGTVLATALLRDPGNALQIPGSSTTLVTMGSPLRNLYGDRFPDQFSWVESLDTAPDAFVTRITPAGGRWVNFYADGDLVGRRLFGPDGGPPLDFPLPFPHGDVYAGGGGHGSYWSSQVVFRRVAELVL